jgi:hypothetical protein
MELSGDDPGAPELRDLQLVRIAGCSRMKVVDDARAPAGPLHVIGEPVHHGHRARGELPPPGSQQTDELPVPVERLLLIDEPAVGGIVLDEQRARESHRVIHPAGEVEGGVVMNPPQESGVMVVLANDRIDELRAQAPLEDPLRSDAKLVEMR